MAGEYEIAYGKAGNPVIKVQVYRNGVKKETTGWVTLTRISPSNEDKQIYRGDKVSGFTLTAGDEIVYYDATDGDDYAVPIGHETFEPVTTPDLSSIIDPAMVTPALYQGDFLQNDEVCFHWNTMPGIDVDWLGTIVVYKDGNETQMDPGVGSGITDTREFDNGSEQLEADVVNLVKIDLSANTWYEPKANYTVVLRSATIRAETVDAVLATFSIENRNQGKQFRRDG
jgi:hypothetical protein